MQQKPRRRLYLSNNEDEHDYNKGSTGPRPVDREDTRKWDRLPYQEELVVLLSNFDDHALIIRDEVDASLFEGDYRKIATAIYTYIDEYQEAPKKHLTGLFVEILSKRADDKQTRAAEYLERILEGIQEHKDQINPQFVLNKAFTFVRQQRLKHTVLGAAESLLSAHTVSDSRNREVEQMLVDAVERNARTRPEPGRLASEIEPQPTDWLFWPYLPAEELSLLGGRKGRRKGQLCAYLVACVTRGRMWPDKSDKAPRVNVLWVEAEDSIDKTVIPRLMANGANRKRIRCLTQAEYNAIPNLRRYIAKHRIRLIIFSPLISFLPKLKNPNAELEVRRVLEQLRDSIQGTRCAIIGIVHLNKKPDLEALERVLGSQAFTAFVRSVVLAEHDAEEEDWTRLVHAAHNLSTKGNDLLYTTQHTGPNPRDQYVKVSVKVASDDIDTSELFSRKPPKKGSAVEWLIEFLRQNGETLREDVLKAGVAAAFKSEALKQARKRNSDKIDWDRDEFQGRTTWFLLGGERAAA